MIAIISKGLMANITLREAVEMATQNNKELQMAKEDVEIARYNYNDVRGQLFPQINLIGNYKLSRNSLPSSIIPPSFSLFDNLDDPVSPNDEKIANSVDRIMASMIPAKDQKEASLVGMIQLQQLIFSGGKLINGIRVLDRVKTLQSQRYELQLQNMVINVIDVYFNMFLAQEVLDIQRQALINAELHLERVENLHRQGLVSEYDKLRAELEVSRLYPEVLNFENMKNLAMENFNRITGNQGEITLNPSLDEITNMSAKFEINLEDALTTATENRIELYLTNLMKDIYQVQLNAERGNYLPNVLLQADVARYNIPSNSYSIGSDFGTMGSVGIVFQMPLFTGLSNSSKALRSRHELRKSEHEDINARELIMLEVRQSWQSFNQSLRLLDIAEKNLALSQRALTIAEARFQNQTGIQLEVFDAQIQFNAAQMSLSQAKIRIIRDYFALNKALGYNLNNMIQELL
jgi:outer membrane protein